MMKKLIIIIIILIIFLLPGCSAKEVENDIDNINTQEPALVDLKGANPGLIEIFYPRSEVLTPPPEYVAKWQTYMQDKHELDIELIYTRIYHPLEFKNQGAPNVGIDISEIEERAVNGGFVYINRDKNFGDLVKSGLIVPVNDYIRGIPSLSDIPDGVLNKFSDSDGNIWAIPLNNAFQSSYRFYNGDWLEKWGKGIPETIDGFFEYAAYIKDNDPDGNGVDDSYIQALRDESILYEFNDIFRSFGCYSDYGQPIGYNPQKGRFEIVLLNENAAEALAFIKNMYDEGFIVPTDLQKIEMAEDKNNYATAHQQAYSALMGCENILAGYYLKGTNKTQLIRLSAGPDCFAVIEGTEGVEEKIEYLIKKVIDKSECFIDLRCGIKEESYRDNGDFFINIFYKDITTRKLFPQISINTNFKVNSIERKPVIFASTEEDLNSELYKEIYLNQFSVWDSFRGEDKKYHDTELVYSVSSLLYSNELDVIVRDIWEITRLTLKNIVTGIVSIEDGLEEYKSKMQSGGFTDRLDDINRN